MLRIKTAVSNGKYRFVQRRKNLKSLARAGLLPVHVKDYIMQLSYLDYFNGPEPEKDNRYPDGEYMFFGCEINQLKFFIKIKLEMRNNEDYCMCISFHIAESTIYYKYRE
ncbi:hypothetical protein M1N64_01900 [Peptococcaceae bacterium]|nr:hypothetical protein [Peptococcaceae bacterium]